MFMAWVSQLRSYEGKSASRPISSKHITPCISTTMSSEVIWGNIFKKSVQIRLKQLIKSQEMNTHENPALCNVVSPSLAPLQTEQGSPRHGRDPCSAHAWRSEL